MAIKDFISIKIIIGYKRLMNLSYMHPKIPSTPKHDTNMAKDMTQA
jgi:hypothetical protein